MLTRGFDFQSILIIGATSGIGWGLAEKFLQEGRKVIVTGRRKERLQKFLNTHGGAGEKLASYEFDVTKLEAIPAFADKVTKEHPDLDAVFFNAGIQRGFNFAKPETVDLDMIALELTTNYTANLHLTKAFLPHFLARQPMCSALIYCTSGFALVPSERVPNYSATKVAMRHFLICLRGHLKNTQVRVIDIIPPAVQTELHNEDVQPDLKDGWKIGIPLDCFVSETWNELCKGNQSDEYPIGPAKHVYDLIKPGRKRC